MIDLLTDDQRAALEDLCAPVMYRAEKTIFWEGQPSHSALIIREGYVKVTRTASDGNEMILAIRGPGYIMGDEGVLMNEARSATVTTTTDVTGLDIKASDLLSFVNDHQLWPAMYRAAVRRRNQSEDEVILPRLDVRSRLARWLVQLADLAGRKIPDGYEIALSLSQQDLAGRIGASRDAVAIELRRFRESKPKRLVTTARRRIVLHDLEALRRISEGKH
jgi:CRP/FNR family transcriptional regulator, cyclic AMP receptor protein